MRYAAWLAVLLFATTLTFAANDGVPPPWAYGFPSAATAAPAAPPPATPAAAPNQPLRGFSEKISAVFNQIAIDPKHESNCRFDLRVVVIFAA